MTEPPAAICRLCQPPEPVEGDIFDHLRLMHPGWDDCGISVTDVTAPFEYQVYRDADFPHGLRCAGCGRLFAEGDPFTERPLCFIGDTPAVELTCLPCAGVSDA